MGDIFDKLFEIAGLSQKKRDEFKEALSKVLVIRIIETLALSRPENARKLSGVITQFPGNSKEIAKTMMEISKDSQTKQIIDGAIDNVLSEVTKLITESATEKEKQQILASL